jgi:general secretion pathway protein J
MNSDHRHRIAGLRAHRGFTLIEVLVAVLIFALLTAAAYAAVDTLLRSRQALHARAQSLQQLQTAMSRIERDLRQAMAVPVRDEYGEAQSLLRGNSSAIEFTRAGFSNPLGQTRARIEHVQWALQDQTLNRASFAVLDRAINSKPQIVPMLNRITGVSFRYFDGVQWRNQWPRPDAPPELPKVLPIAVALEIETTDHGLLRRVVAMVEPSVHSVSPPGGNP